MTDEELTTQLRIQDHSEMCLAAANRIEAITEQIAAKDAALTAAMDALNELARHPEDEGHSMPGDFRDYYRDACNFAKQKVEEISAMKGDTHE